MNLEQFKAIAYSLNYKFSRLVKAVKLDLEVFEEGSHYEIDVMNGDKRVGFMTFLANDNRKEIIVDIVIVQKEYQESSAAAKILTEFRKIYKEKYWGYNIVAEFYNQKLSETFDQLVEKGKFPEGVNKTTTLQMSEKKYQEWADGIDKQFFDKNRTDEQNTNQQTTQNGKKPSALLPQPYRKYIDVKDDNYFGTDVVYKNLSAEDAQLLSTMASKYNMQWTLNTLMFTKSSVFSSCSDKFISDDIINDLKPNLLYYYLGGNIITTVDLKLVKEKAQQISSLVNTNIFDKLTIYLQLGSNITSSTSNESYVVNSEQELDDLINNQKVAIKRLKRTLV